MINIIGVGLYGRMSLDSQAAGIPGCLIVISEDIQVTCREPAITGWRGNVLSAAAYEDGLLVSTGSLRDVDDDIAGLRVNGLERTVYAIDYLVSKSDMHGEYMGDGLQIHFAGKAKFSLEKIKKKK